MRPVSSDVTERHIAGLGIGILLSFYALIVLVDIWNAFGFRDLLAGSTVPLLWNFLFQERGPVEILQWTFLGLFIVTAAYLSGILGEREQHGERMFWLLMAVGAVFMLMEDAGNIRHFLLREQILLEWTMLKRLETLYFGLIALLPVAAVIRYGTYIKQHRTTVLLLAIGFATYGLAAVISGPGELYANRLIGGTLYETTATLGGDELRTIYEETNQRLAERAGNGFLDIRARFTDYLVEESLEFLGVTFFLASAVAYLRYVRTRTPL